MAWLQYGLVQAVEVSDIQMIQNIPKPKAKGGQRAKVPNGGKGPKYQMTKSGNIEIICIDQHHHDFVFEWMWWLKSRHDTVHRNSWCQWCVVSVSGSWCLDSSLHFSSVCSVDQPHYISHNNTGLQTWSLSWSDHWPLTLWLHLRLAYTHLTWVQNLAKSCLLDLKTWGWVQCFQQFFDQIMGTVDRKTAKDTASPRPRLRLSNRRHRYRGLWLSVSVTVIRCTTIWKSLWWDVLL